MRIQNNIMAMNTHRMYTNNNAAVSKSAEKLSSGYRINRAGDDAAGLAISEKMRSQIRGLTMASKNSQDAISLVQTAEGALQEVHSMLQRMNELSVQSATGTNENFDRAQLDAEFKQLVEEIDQVAVTTNFNNMKLLDGSLSGIADVGFTDATAAQAAFSTSVTSGGTNAKAQSVTTIALEDLAIGDKIQIGDKTYTIDAGDLDGDLTFLTKLKAGVANANKVDVDAITYTGGKLTVAADTANDATYNYDDNVKASYTPVPRNTLDFTANNLDHGAGIKVGDKTYRMQVDGQTVFNQGANDVLVPVNGAATAETVAQAFADAINADITNYAASIVGSKVNVASNGADTTASSASLIGGGLVIQIGAEQGNTLNIKIDAMNSTVLGLKDKDIASQAKAGDAITATRAAVSKVSEQRSILGAMQNRLEHKISNLDNTAENLQAAESRIRDCDIAKEMTNYTKNNILSQAATAMLAQANAAPQNVLSLLQ